MAPRADSRGGATRQAFQRIDLNNDGRLSKEEIRVALDGWGIDLKLEDLGRLWSVCDENEDGAALHGHRAPL